MSDVDISEEAVKRLVRQLRGGFTYNEMQDAISGGLDTRALAADMLQALYSDRSGYAATVAQMTRGMQQMRERERDLVEVVAELRMRLAVHAKHTEDLMADVRADKALARTTGERA